MSWGGARRVEARITDGTSTIAFDLYTVMTMINVIPDEINNTVCQTVMVEGTGFYYDTDDVEGWLVFIDNEQYFGYWDFFHLGINSTGYVMFNFAAAGFRPGLHVVSVIPESYGALPMTIAAKDNFWVTYEGDLIKMNLDAYLESINVTVTAIWDGMASLETAMGEVTVTLAELDATIMEVDGNIATLSTSIGTIQTTLTSLNSKVTSISNDIANIDTDLGPVMTKLDSIDAVIGAMYGDVVTINTTIGTFETTLDALDATITSVESTVGDIDDVTGLIAGDVIEIQTTLGTITGNITDIQDSIATIETDLGTVKVDLATAKTDIAAVETDVNDNLPVDMLPVWIAVVLALIAAIGSIAGVFIIQRKIA
jgi:prefoldin subunit 5